MGNSDLAAVEAKYQKVAETIQHLTQENAHLKRELEEARNAPRDNGENAALKAEIAALQETVAGLEQVRDNLIEKINTLYMVAGTEKSDGAEVHEKPAAKKPEPVEPPKAAPRVEPPTPLSAVVPPKAPERVEVKPAPVEPPKPAPVAHAVPPTPVPAPAVRTPAPHAAPEAAPVSHVESPKPAQVAPVQKPVKDDDWQDDSPFDAEDDAVFEDNDEFFRSLTSKDSE